MFEQNFTVTNIHCPSCIVVSRQALLALPGVTEVTIEQADGHGTVHASQPLDGAAIIHALRAVGKGAVLRA